MGEPAGMARAASRVIRGSAAGQPLPLGQLESSCPFQAARGPPPFPQVPTDPSLGEAALGDNAGAQSLRAALPRVQVAPISGGAAPTSAPRPGPTRPCPALAGLTLSARWWTRPRPGSASICSSPSSGNSRRPATKRGHPGPEGPTGAGAAMFVPTSPAASSTAHFRGQRAPGAGRAWEWGRRRHAKRRVWPFYWIVRPRKSPTGRR